MRVLFPIHIFPVFCILISLSPAVNAAEPAAMQAVVVSGSKASLLGIADSATEGTVTAQQLATRPLLRAAPTMVRLCH